MTEPRKDLGRRAQVASTADAETGAMLPTGNTHLAVWRRITTSTSAEYLVVALILAITIWIAHFSQSFHRGLYEDDWAFIGQPMGWTWAQTISNAWTDLRVWPQGRPLGFAAWPLLVFLGNRLGGLEGIYGIAFGLHLTNTFLLYLIVRRKLSPPSSLCAALGFALFPSNTTVPLLEAQLFNGLTLFFLLFALWLYMSGRRLPAYLVSSGSLLIYESAFLPFLVAPLLRPNPATKLHRELLKHWAAVLAIAGVIFLFRVHMGEAKTLAVMGDGPWQTVTKVGVAMYSGTVTTLRLSVLRLATILRDGDHDVFLVVAIMAVGLTLALYFSLKEELSDKDELWPLSFTNRWFRFQASVTIDQTSAAALRLGACGIVMLVLAYALAISQYYYPPVVEAGRLTATHLSAGVGASLIYGAVSALLFNLGASRRKKFLAVLIVACYFSGLTGFHYLVQEDFVKAWTLERSFWKAVSQQCPDVTDGTVLIYESETYPTTYILVNSWGDPLVLGELYDFPRNWKQAPELFSVPDTWTGDVTLSDGKPFWQPPAPWPSELLPEGNVILLRGLPGKGLERVTGTIKIKGAEFRLKPRPATSDFPVYPHGALYKYVLQ